MSKHARDYKRNQERIILNKKMRNMNYQGTRQYITLPSSPASLVQEGGVVVVERMGLLDRIKSNLCYVLLFVLHICKNS